LPLCKTLEEMRALRTPCIEDTLETASCATPQYVQPNCATPQYVQPNCATPQYVQPNCGTPQYVQPNCATPQYVQPNCATPQYVQPNCATPQCVTHLLGNTCVFYPYVCSQNRPRLHDWCRYCTHRRLFPEQVPCEYRQVCPRN